MNPAPTAPLNCSRPKHQAAADALEAFLICLLPSAEFHPALEFGAAGGGVFANSVLAEQAIHAHPGGPMRARRGWNRCMLVNAQAAHCFDIVMVHRRAPAKWGENKFHPWFANSR